MLLYNIVAVILPYLINADKRIKGMQIVDDEIKIVSFTDNTTIFLRDITWESFKKYVHSRFPSFEPPPPCLVLIPPLEGTFSPSPLISIPGKFREKKLLMNTSIFGWIQCVF